MSLASPIPAVFLAGMSQDSPSQPLSECGAGNPAFYHTWFDDFDDALDFTTGDVYTLSGTSATFAASTTLAGGVGVLSTEAVADQIAQIQLVYASFAQNIAPKKLFFEARLPAFTNLANGALVLGLCNVGAAITAATGAVAATDGIYFSYVGSTGVLTLHQATGSTVSSVTIPAAAYSVGASIDLAFRQDRNGDILAYVDGSLVGYADQDSGNGGALARILGTSYTASTALLTPTLAVWNSNGTATVANVDFWTASQER